MIRGIEITPEVADGPQSCVLEQVTNGVAVRMALLFLLIPAPRKRRHPVAAQRRRIAPPRIRRSTDKKESTACF